MGKHSQLERTASGLLTEPQRSVEPRSAATHAWSRPRSAAAALLLGFVALATLPPVVAPGRSDGAPLAYELGRRAALSGSGLLALLVVLSSRLRVADVALGLGAAIRLHRAVGVLTLLLLLAHPALLLLATRGELPLEWPIVLGASALGLLVVGVLAALLLRLLRLDYGRWRAVHKSMILVVVLGCVHGRAIGEDLRTSLPWSLWSASLLAVALAIFAWRNVVVPRWGRRRLCVIEVAQEARHTWTITFAPERGEPLRYEPGQFVFLTLVRPGLPAEEHPFTLSSSPTRAGVVTATIKESGDYSRTIALTRPGDRALVEGPFGRFSLVHDDAERFLFVSAGVGCTPIVSMLRYLRDTADTRPVLFLCANRTEGDIAFRDELTRLPSTVEVVHVLSRAGASWGGARGHLDEAMLRDFAGASLHDASVYACGPPAFVQEVRRSLRRLRVPRARIHVERFAVP